MSQMPCQKIAEVMGQPTATVKSHLHRGRAKLREMLADIGQVDWQALRLA